MEIYFVNLRIQTEHRKIPTRNNSVFGHFSRSGFVQKATMIFLLPLHMMRIDKNQALKKIKNIVKKLYAKVGNQE